MKSKPQTGWYLLVEAYLYTAKILADEINICAQEFIYKEKFQGLVVLAPLLFSTIFNARHGIELFLKSLIVIQHNGKLPKKYHSHDLGILFNFLEEGRDGLVPIYSIKTILQGVNFEHDLDTFKSISIKYQEYDFSNLPVFLNKNLIKKINDNMNMAFRFPDNDSLNEAIRFLLDNKRTCFTRVDIDDYKKKMFPYLQSIICLTKEIDMDMNEMLRINVTIGNTMAAHINKNQVRIAQQTN